MSFSCCKRQERLWRAMNTLWHTCWRWPWTPCDPTPTWGWGRDILQQLQPASQVGEGQAYTVTLCNTVWHYVTQYTHQRRQTGRPSEAIASGSGWRWTYTQCNTVWHYTHLGRRTGQPSVRSRCLRHTCASLNPFTAIMLLKKQPIKLRNLTSLSRC